MKLLPVAFIFLIAFNQSGLCQQKHVPDPNAKADGRHVEAGSPAFAAAKLAIVRDTCDDYRRGTNYGVVAHYNCVNLREAVKNTSFLASDCSGNAGRIGGPQGSMGNYGVSCGIFSAVLRNMGCGSFSGQDRLKCDAVNSAFHRRQCITGLPQTFQQQLCRGIHLGIEQTQAAGCRNLESIPQSTCEQLVRLGLANFLRHRP